MGDTFKFLALVALLTGQVCGMEVLPVPAAPRERISINDHWRFTKGDPTSFEPFQSRDRKVFNGHCLVIVRDQPGKPGTIKITAQAKGLQITTAIFKTLSP